MFQTSVQKISKTILHIQLSSHEYNTKINDTEPSNSSEKTTRRLYFSSLTKQEDHYFTNIYSYHI